MWDKAAALCESIAHMHKAHVRDAGDSMLMAYDQGTFTKVRLPRRGNILQSGVANWLVQGILACQMVGVLMGVLMEWWGC
jgi:hypothetical protein